MNTFARFLIPRLFIASLAVLIGCQSSQPRTQSAPSTAAHDQIDAVFAHKLLRLAISQYRADGIEVPRDNFNEMSSETIKVPGLLLPLIKATNTRELLSSKEFGRSLDMEERQLAWLCWRINGNQGISIRIDPPSNEQTKWVVIEIIYRADRVQIAPTSSSKMIGHGRVRLPLRVGGESSSQWQVADCGFDCG